MKNVIIDGIAFSPATARLIRSREALVGAQISVSETRNHADAETACSARGELVGAESEAAAAWDAYFVELAG